MSVKSVIKDINKGKKGRAVAHIGGADVDLKRKGGTATFEGGPAGISATKLRQAMMLNIANGGKLDIKGPDKERETARATAKTFRQKAAKRLIASLEAWGSGFPDKQKDAKALRAYRKEHPEVFI